jgi:hypothetical protein
MPERSRKQGRSPAATEKDPLAAELGRRGGIKGGKARAERLPPELRRAIAKHAAAMRWARQRAESAGEKPRLPAIPAAETVATVTLAGVALQVARLEDGRRVVGQLSAEAALGEALAPEAASVVFHVPGDWQLRRGLTAEAFARLLGARAAAGRETALELLVACAAPGLDALVDRATEAEPAPA